MNEYDLINCYLNLIFDNSFTYFTRILDGYVNLENGCVNATLI